MIRLVTIKNPFQPWQGRTIKDYPAGFTAKELVSLAGFDDMDIHCSVDGSTIETIDTYVIPDDTIMVISPVVSKGGKSIVALVASIALSFAVAGMTASIATQAWAGAANVGGQWVATAASKFVAYSIAAATMFVGSTLIGRFVGTGTLKGNDSENDPTYSWQGVQTTEGQDNPIVMTYGKVKSAGQTIGRYIEVEDNKEYLNWLISAGEGPIEFSDIQINDNDIDYYQSIDVETRPGINNQDVISNFNDTYAAKGLNRQLEDQEEDEDEFEYIETVPGASTQGIKVKVECSNGLYSVANNGDLKDAYIILGGWYRRVGATNWTSFIGSPAEASELPDGITTWQDNVVPGRYVLTCSQESEESSRFRCVLTFPDYTSETAIADIWTIKKTGIKLGSFLIKQDYGRVVFAVGESPGVRITDNVASAVRREYRVDNLPEGEYEVKLKVLGRSHKTTDTKASTKIYWTMVTSIVYDDFIYPGVALIGIKALATDQINGTPSISFIKERKNVWVYNSKTKSYEEKPANNPAWASYDMLHLCSYLYNVNTNQYEYEVRGVPADHIIYEQFEEWADFCTQKNFTVNIEIAQAGEMLDTINSNLANCGRGVVIRFGTKYGAVWESVKQPVQMFGMGNIIAGTFKEDFLQVSDRANCVEVTYNDAEQGYNRNAITIYGPSYDSDPQEKTAQATYNGITNYKQAYREGMYQLYCNRYQLRTISFEANIDAIACTVGDVILVSHDVPKWAYSGRIEAVDLVRGIFTLPIEIVDTSKAYRIMYRTVKDNRYESAINIIENENGWCTVELLQAPNPDDPPQRFDIFDIAEQNIGSKPFIVKTISRAQDFTRRIECLEYHENLYNEDYTIPPVQYSLDDNQRAKNVINLTAQQISYISPDGVKQSKLFASWEAPDNGGTFTVLLSTDRKKYTVLQSGITANSIEADVVYGQSYMVQVITSLGITKSTGVIVGPINKGADIAPPDVTALYVETLPNGVKRCSWDFKYPNPNDIKGFKIKYIEGNEIDWEQGVELHNGYISGQPFECVFTKAGQYVAMIKAVDNANHESVNYAACVMNFGDPVEENVLQKIELGNSVWTNPDALITHNGVIAADGSLQSKVNESQNASAFWKSEDAIFWKKRTKTFWSARFVPLDFKIRYVAKADGYLWLDANILNSSAYYFIDGKTTSRVKLDSKVWVEAGDRITIQVLGTESRRVTITHMNVIIDVPDVEERFNNLSISASGTVLPIQTPNYETVGVNLSSMTIDDTNAIYDLEIVSKKPCKVKINKITINNGRMVKTAINAVASLIWQGYQAKTI